MPDQLGKLWGVELKIAKQKLALLGGFKPILAVEGGHLALFSNLCMKAKISLYHQDFFFYNAGSFFSWQHFNIKLRCSYSVTFDYCIFMVLSSINQVCGATEIFVVRALVLGNIVWLREAPVPSPMTTSIVCISTPISSKRPTFGEIASC